MLITKIYICDVYLSNSDPWLASILGLFILSYNYLYISMLMILSSICPSLERTPQSAFQIFQPG